MSNWKKKRKTTTGVGDTFYSYDKITEFLRYSTTLPYVVLIIIILYMRIILILTIMYWNSAKSEKKNWTLSAKSGDKKKLLHTHE